MSVDYNIALAHPVVDQFAAPVRTDHEQGRNLALADPGGKFDEHLGAVVERATRTPRCILAIDAVAYIEPSDLRPVGDRRFCRRCLLCTPPRSPQVMLIIPDTP